jgi:predicted ribonuclease YlaK
MFLALRDILSGLTKKEKIRKIMEANQESASILRNFNLNDIKPLTENQSLTFEAYEKGKHLMLHGVPGSGKTFVAMFLALRDILSGKTQYDKMVIVRSVVPTRDQGFQPGTKAEKEAVYESPYYINCSELFNRGDAYSYLKKREIIQFISTSFIRGITINNSVIIVDEMQNMTAAELNTVITRTGKNCRLIFCGDIAQTDLLNPKKEKNWSW